MKMINVRSWEEFEEQIRGLENERRKQSSLDQFLYRGQGNCSWRLLTTLERRTPDLSLKEYHRLILDVKPHIHSFAAPCWNVLSLEESEEFFDKDMSLLLCGFGSEQFQDTYGYMAYLRHYGFPSPLLDWTSCPGVAAYFAFREPRECGNDVSIYVYLESTSDFAMKSRASNTPHIHRFGPRVETDLRHHRQKSQYTICLIHNRDVWRYASHENIFVTPDSGQDVLWKFNIPYSQRIKVLHSLDSRGINAVCLFGSEEAAVETMALRKIDFQDSK